MRKNKNIYIVLIMVLLIGVSIGFAYLNSTLVINGKSNISKNVWDIHFENINLTEGSATDNLPELSSNIITLNTTLNKPGDYYSFTVDVVNSGTISAIVEDIEMLVDDMEKHSKYLNVTVKYLDGSYILDKPYLIAGKTKTLNIIIEYLKDIEAADLPQEPTNVNASFNILYGQIDNNAETEITILGRTWNSKIGISLYDSINNNYDKYESQNNSTVNTFPRATEYFVSAYGSDVDNIILDENGKMLNLKNNFVDPEVTYNTTYYNRGTKITDERFYGGDYITTMIDVSLCVDAEATRKPLPIFVDQNDTYVNVAHATYLVLAFFAPASSIESMEQEIISDYILGIPAGQDTGCSGEAGIHRFSAFLDEDGNICKMTDKVNHLDKRYLFNVDISIEDATYEEAKAQVLEMLDAYLNGEM